MTNQITELPLSDGTACLISAVARILLEDDFGVTKGRMKRSGGYRYVCVQPRSKRWPDSREVPLLDLLAVMVYGLPQIDAGQKWVTLDGDPRNLLPGNIAETGKPELRLKAEKQRIKPPFVDTPDIQRQLDMLVSAMDALRAIGIAILQNAPLAEEILAQVTLNLVEQIRAGAFRGRTAGEFHAWIRAVARTQFRVRLRGALEHFLADVEPDRCELRLKSTMERNPDCIDWAERETTFV